jgi:uncharacterized membrane protein YhhN
MINQKMILPYIIVSSLHLVVIILGYELLTTGTKILLMPALCYFVWQKAMIVFDKKLLFAALFFSWLGDCFLLLKINPNFFLLGLGSFFLAHVSYIIFFNKNGNLPKINGLNIIIFLMAFLNLGFMLSQLLPVIDAPMRAPVIAYGTILTVALCSCTLMQAKIEQRWQFLFFGIILFIISDSLIAFYRFKPEAVVLIASQISLLIMLTYVVAQGMIIFSLSKK